MKKFIVPALFAVALGFTSCSAEAVVEAIEEASCNEITNQYTNALQKFTDDPSVANCEALTAAISAYKTADCTGADLIPEVGECE